MLGVPIEYTDSQLKGEMSSRAARMRSTGRMLRGKNIYIFWVMLIIDRRQGWNTYALSPTLISING